MAFGLTYFARQLLNDPAEFRRGLEAPVLVWEAPPQTAPEKHLLGTFSGYTQPRPTAKDPLAFVLRKGNSRQNAFGLGITVGRTENNDVFVDDNSVSRFHAFFQKDSKGRWTVADAESKNGTYVDGFKLEGRKGREIKTKAKIRFGQVDMVFLDPDDFVAYVRLKLEQH